MANVMRVGHTLVVVNMACVRQVRTHDLSFQHFPENFLKPIINLAKFASPIDVVSNVNKKNSIEDV